MADIIQLLPDSVANQIAAGEVVQRPASVVKELMENAIDAGATQVKLHVKDSGRTLIQVSDNGCGMTETDARLSIERHATSKIKTVNDLFAIKSMGFRGEALASIAAISHMEFKTKKSGDELGTLITVEGSEVNDQKPIQTTEGTSISVKNLFYNVPARRNFLKSNKVEMRHIIEEFNKMALSHPEIIMELHDNGQTRFQLPSSNLKQRIVNLFGKQLDKRLVPVDVDTSLVKIHGFTGKPEQAKKTRGEQYFFVNNRYFRHPYFHHAVENAYENLLTDKKYPSYFLFFEIDPRKIDINIHPTKNEINFEDGQGIYAILRSGIKKALGTHNLTPSIDFDVEQSMQQVPSRPDGPVKQPRVQMTPGYNPFESQHGPQSSATATKTEREKHNRENWEELYRQPESDESTDNEILSGEEEESNGNEVLQLHKQFIVTSIKSGLMLIDQQRAHERVLYENFMSRLQNTGGPSQKLMFPETVSLSPADNELFEEISRDIKALGFDFNRKDAQTLEFTASPAGFEKEVQPLVESVLEDYKSRMMNASSDRHNNLASAMAKKTAIRSGRKLEEQEMKALIDSLFACSMPEHSIDGKPIIRVIGTEDLKQMFH